MTTLYELVGGDQWFVDLVDRFYDAVDQDEILRPLYPEDLTESRAHMVGFLVQYWGGPAMIGFTATAAASRFVEREGGSE